MTTFSFAYLLLTSNRPSAAQLTLVLRPDETVMLVKDKIQSRMPVQITRRAHGITCAASGFIPLQNLIPFEHRQATLHIILRDAGRLLRFLPAPAPASVRARR